MSLESRRRPSPIWLLAVLLLLPLAAATLAAPQELEDGTLRIYYLDVGQGDAAVAVTPNGVVVGFDAGPISACQNVIDAYSDLGVTEIDYLVVSHYDADHIGCVPELLDRFPVREMVLDRRGRHSTQTFKEYKRAVGKKRKKARPGRTFTLDKTSRFDASPVELDVIAVNGRYKGGKVAVPTSNQNDRGLVVRLRMGEFEALFGGDVSGTNESGHKDIESAIGPLVGDIEVYKVHHHGSKFSSSEAFLEVIKPKASILSMGHRNQYGHPTRETLNALHDLQKPRTFWTTRGGGVNPQRRFDRVCGDITVRTEPGSDEFTVHCPDRRKTETFTNTTDDGGGGGGGGGGGEEVPGVPGNLSANVTGTNVTITWQAPNTGGEATSYLLHVGTSPGGSNTFAGEQAGTSRTLTGLSAGTYYARLRARNAGGFSAWTANVSFVIHGGGGGGSYNITVQLDVEAEEVRITNNSSQPVNMHGWKLRDNGNLHTYTFNGYTLAGSYTVIVTSGPGAKHQPPKYLKGWGTYVWNNEGDTARLFDADGKLVAQGSDS